MKKFSSAWWKLNKQSGFLLLELAISITFTVILLSMLLQGFSQLLPTWGRIYSTTNLYNAGQYMLNILEKNIAYDSSTIIISKDAKVRDRLNCQTIWGNQSFTFTFEGDYIYKTITKNASSGKTPLFISDCKIIDWKLTKLSSKKLQIELELQQKGHKIKFNRIISCINGVIV